MIIIFYIMKSYDIIYIVNGIAQKQIYFFDHNIHRLA